MLRALLMTMILLAFPMSSAFSVAADADGNAALKYWQAFATLPKFNENESKIVGNCLTAPLDETVKSMLASSKYSLEMMHRGAALRRCDWGMKFDDDGVFALLPYVDAGRTLGSLAFLQARQHLEAGENAAAIDDLVAAATLGRHISHDGTLVALLAGYANERRVIELTASYLPNLDQKTTQELKARLDAMPPFGAPGAALMITEKKSLEWFIRKVKETKGKDDLLEFLSWIDISEEPSKKSAPRAPKFVEECGGTAAGVVQFAEKVLPHFDATAKMFDLPLDQFDKALQRQSAEMADNPVYKLFFPAIINVRQAKARADVRQAEFLAAIAVRLEGQGALKTRLDPVTNEPFEYVAVPGGFELRSTVKGQDDAPITLTVGRRGSSSSRPVNR